MIVVDFSSSDETKTQGSIRIHRCPLIGAGTCQYALSTMACAPERVEFRLLTKKGRVKPILQNQSYHKTGSKE